MIQLITATGCRPEGFALCTHYMARQTYQGAVRWIIVDDGAEETPVTFQREGWDVEVIRPEPKWMPGENTQHRNLHLALDRIDDRYPVAIIEDDDWYSPEYLEVATNALAKAELVGQRSCWKYSLLNSRAKIWPNPKMSSLCASVFRDGAIRVFRELVAIRPKLIDMHLWRRVPGHLFEGRHSVGIKGVPGRTGIDSGHQHGFGDIADPEGSLLRQWIGSDAAAYEPWRNKGPKINPYSHKHRRHPPFGVVTQHHDRVLIVGSGPSAAYFVTNPLPDCTVIALNRTHEFLRRCDYWFTQDQGFAFHKLMKTPSKAQRVASVPPDVLHHRWAIIPEDVLLLSADRRQEGLSDDPHTLSHGNSAYGALGLAKHFGASRIGMIGVDGTTDSYWHSEGKSNNLKHLPGLFAKASGVNVKVATGSKVECFPQASPDEICQWLDAP